jgi:phosphoribosylaminoimidazole-succinocarboxamide synthase
MLVRRLKPILVEAVVRGYLAGSGWKEYQDSQSVCGVPLPAGLKNASKLPEPIYTPAAKAAAGEHDENITFERTVELIGRTWPPASATSAWPSTRRPPPSR